MTINKIINIGDKSISPTSSPFVIAEIGSNFNQDIDLAKKLISIAAESKADAVKFQLFDSKTLYPDGGDMYKIFKSIELNPKWIKELKSTAEDLGLIFMASCFDFKSVDVMEEAGVVAHKIASSEATNLDLVAYIASTQKPIFLSTGMCDSVDVQEAINACLNFDNDQICLLQCTAQYPLKIEDANLRVISTFKSIYNCNVGFSDHSLSNIQAVTAIGLGANIFEKHITLDKSSSGPDHFYALEPNQLKLYIDEIHEAFESLGSGIKKMSDSEKKEGRRDGLYYSDDFLKGDSLSQAKVIIKRPALDIRSRYLGMIIKAKLKHNVFKDDPIKWEDLEF